MHQVIGLFAAGPVRVGQHPDAKQRRQTRTEYQSHNKDLENAFQVVHQRVLRVVAGRGQTEVVVLILVLVLAASAASRTSAGTTELVELSQSALTLLLSTFCFEARHHM